MIHNFLICFFIQLPSIFIRFFWMFAHQGYWSVIFFLWLCYQDHRMSLKIIWENECEFFFTRPQWVDTLRRLLSILVILATQNGLLIANQGYWGFSGASWLFGRDLEGLEGQLVVFCRHRWVHNMAMPLSEDMAWWFQPLRLE